jgi:RND family efflux transporter MFP subunit
MERIMKQLGSSIMKYWRIWTGLIGLIVVLVWAGGGCRDKVSPGRVERLEGRPLPQNAALYTARVENVAARVDVVGTVASEQKIHISARIPAHVAEVFVSAGDPVKKGQVLLTLDDREIREQLIAAEAQLKQAETEYERAKQLFEKNATTQQALTAAESAYLAAKARVDQVRVMLSYAQVASPIDGIVTERRVEVGDLAAPGMILTAVYDPTRMRLEAPVPLRLVERIALGQEVEVTLDRPRRTVKGQVTEIVSEADPATRTQLVKIHLEDVANQVLPGTFGRLWVEEAPRPALLVPAQAVRRIGQLEMVQTVVSNRAVLQLVKTGPSYGDQVEILSALKDGDVILLNSAEE